MSISERIPSDMSDDIAIFVEQQFRKHNPTLNPMSKKAQRWILENAGIEVQWNSTSRRFVPYRIANDQKFIMFKLMS